MTVTESGARGASGSVVIADVLPEGLRALRAQLLLAKNQLTYHEGEFPEGTEVGACHTVEQRHVTCEAGELAPDQRLQAVILVAVAPEAKAAANVAEVYEAGRMIARSDADDTISFEAAGFGVSGLVSELTAVDGVSDAQAGDHPYEQVTRFDLGTRMAARPDTGARGLTTSGHGLKDVVVDLPQGVVGSAVATPRCTFSQLQSQAGCPADTSVGHIATEPGDTNTSVNTPLFNMVSEHGVAAEFGFVDGVETTHVIYASVAPTPQGYVLRATAREIPDIVLWNVISTFYGDPGERFDQSHLVCTYIGEDENRFENSDCTQESAEHVGNYEYEQGTTLAQVPFFTNPSDCSGEPLVSRVYADSWLNPGGYADNGTPEGEPLLPNVGEASNWKEASSEAPPVEGCNALRFSPSAFSVQPDTTQTDSPTGLSFELALPQPETAGTTATPPLRDATVTLPAGVTVDPSFAAGLEACSEQQIGWRGKNNPVNQAEELPNHGLTNFDGRAPECPESSKVGTLELTTPVLEGSLRGELFLARQYENPFDSLLAGYIVINDPRTGTIVKIPGELKTNPETGQITGAFKENPQLPFSDLKLRFFGGPKGELGTPQSCGSYTTTSDLMPWSAPESGPDATPSSSFEINNNCGLGFNPTFAAGTTSNQAGGFSPETVTLARNDGEQHLLGLTVTNPAGLAGILTGIPLCPEAQANAGTCSGESLIGESTVTSGVGATPYVLHGGRVYLTGPYNGGPFGLSIVTPAVAGPFNLGKVVVRASLRIDSHTAQVTVVSDPFPQMVDSVEGLRSGIPADLRSVTVTINRPGFTFNPTSCEPTALTATAAGASGGSAPLTARFQAADCGALKFSPTFSASTSAQTSKVDGASLTTRVQEPAGSLGTQADVAKVKVQLPLSLPSRLSTLQQACLARTFAENPAACPAASVVGHAIVHTPLLPVPLEGPAYFVSNGAEAFPNLIMVLQGYGVTIDLVGDTDIKKGITYTTFKAVPDTPFTTFELTLPEGPHSALAATGSLCEQQGKLTIPNEFTAQNGAQIHETTPIAVEGCKPAIYVVSHHVKGQVATLVVSVPSAGRLLASATGLSGAAKQAGGAGTVTLKLRLTRGEAVLLSHHHGRKLKVKIHLAFKPRQGSSVASGVAVVVG